MSVATPELTRTSTSVRVRSTDSGHGLGLWLTRLALIAICFVVLLPAIWVVVASLSPGSSAFSASIIPSAVTLQHYADIINAGFFTWLKNSIIVSGSVAIISLMINTLAAYAFSRLRFAGKRYGLMALFLIQMFPATMALPIYYTLLIRINLYDTLPGVILIFLGSSAFEIWLLKNYIDSIPRELDEAALIDGTSSFQLFYMILLPLIRPMLVTVVIWNFSGSYADIIFSSLMLESPEHYTVMVGLYHTISGAYATNWTLFAAGAVLAATPILVIYLALQRQLISGLASGAVKG